MILSAVWGTGYGKEAGYLHAYVHRLRQKLDDRSATLHPHRSRCRLQHRVRSGGRVMRHPPPPVGTRGRARSLSSHRVQG